MTVDCRGSLRLRVGKGARGPLNHARSGWVALASAVPGSLDDPTASSEAGDSSSLATALWADARVVELREACLRTGFIRGLASGALPKLNFAGYAAQVRG